MPNPLVSIAVLEPLDGQEQAVLEVIRDLYTLMDQKGYSENQLLRSRGEPIYLINIRYWSSEQARREAQEDPEILRLLERMGRVCSIPRVHEMMDLLDWKELAASEAGD